MPILTAGSVLSNTYRVIRPLAAGAMGAVYEAEHLRLGRRVAIKVLRDEFRRHPDALVRFRREAETVGRLQNPHIVQVFDVHETDQGDPYFVMEFL
ncbi:MAG TPA: protein kinase, partial [Polyangiaceae bacterium]|nr:protein kinase [Polyangiaceae bacterium]